jgi:ADP-ribose pyrophosphatase YjhB (NUDIX family)
MGESPHQAAAPELFEEMGAVVDSDSLLLFQIGHIMDINQIYLVFRGKLDKPELQTSEEAEEVALFAESEATSVILESRGADRTG